MANFLTQEVTERWLRQRVVLEVEAVEVQLQDHQVSEIQISEAALGSALEIVSPQNCVTHLRF
jgi:hypothetical protein